MKKAQEAKKNIWRTRKIIHMEFDSDDDVDEQTKNSSNVKTEGKVRVKKRITHYYEFSSDEEEGKRADPKTVQKTQEGHENQVKNDENDQALVSNEMTLSSIGKDIFIGDSAATSHMTNNRTGVYLRSSTDQRLSYDREWREHQLYPQRQAGCYLQTQRWFHSSTDMGSKDCTTIKP